MTTRLPLRLALIGTGHIAAEHVEAIRPHAERAEIAAATDVDGAALAAFCQTHDIPRAYDDAAELLRREQPDVVLISSPPFTHAALAEQAMEAGADVVCEKPMVVSLAQMDDLQEAERRTGRTCVSISQWRYGSAAGHVKRLIESGELGEPLVAVCNTLWYRPPEYYTSVPWRSRWATEGGGVALGLGIHAMDLTLWLMDDWEEVTGYVAARDRAVEVETIAMAHVRFSSGAAASFVNSAVSPRQNSYIRLDFQNATIEVDHLYQYRNEHWRFSVPDRPEPIARLPHWRRIEGDQPGALATQWTALIDDFLGGRTPLTHTSQVRSTYDFLASLYKSALTRQPVRRLSIQPGDPFYESMNGAAETIP
ncbi:MAG: Gfo/Idh/MocA family oxidoreductase [Anaerolineae bacterium]|nr:Gfo/Idh/MocA family oxidoreductase [Anaerolineae bacterium]